MSLPDDDLFIDRLRLVRGMIRARAEQEQREIAEYLSRTSATGSEIYNLTGQQLTRKQVNTRQRMRAKNKNFAEQFGGLKPFKRKQRAKPFLTAKDLILLREMKIGL